MAQGDIYRMVRTVLVDGQTCVNVLHFLDTLGNINDPETVLLDSWNEEFQTEKPEIQYQRTMRGYTSLVLVSVTAQRIFPTEGDIVSQSPAQAAETATDSGLPTFSQIKVNISTDRKDRSGKGGFFMSGIAETATTGNAFTQSFLDDVAVFMNILLQVYNAGGANFSGFQLGVWSRLLSEFNAVTSLSAATTVGTMVSRRVGHGV